jgi:hypothetical protein
MYGFKREVVSNIWLANGVTLPAHSQQGLIFQRG